MPPKFNYTTGALLAAVIYDIGVHIKHKRRLNELADRNIDLQHAVIRSQAQVKYLALLIDRNEITVDEFDMIMLNDPPIK